MKATTHQTTTARDQEGQQAPEWLAKDLEAVLDYCVQEGDYSTVEAMLEQAGRDGYTLDECTPALYAVCHME